LPGSSSLSEGLDSANANVRGLVESQKVDGDGGQEKPLQLAGSTGTPGNNQAQNRQVRAIVVEIGLTPAQRQQLHREISGQNFNYKVIREIAIGIKTGK
jgi:hypothetical protein